MANKNHYMADYQSKGKKPGQYKPKIDSNGGGYYAEKNDRSGLPKGPSEGSNRAAMGRNASREKLYSDVLSTKPEILMKELHLAKKEIETLKN